jgi:mannitol/fructose-specific phosphotransferase system IIA component (Ntr-type)
MPVALAEILHEQQVTLRLQARTLENAVRELVQLLAANGKIDNVDEFVAQVLAREEANPSLNEYGVAFPHARTELVDEIVLAIGRSRGGIPFGESGERAQLIFLIGVPQRLLNDYLVVIGTLARATQDEVTRTALLRATTAAELIETLRGVPSL